MIRQFSLGIFTKQIKKNNILGDKARIIKRNHDWMALQKASPFLRFQP
jgi:hypothetical protein